jgi:alpha-1,2-mannosyltransferase
MDAPTTVRSGTAWRVAVVAAVTAVAVVAHVWYGLRNRFFDLEIYREAMLWWADGNQLYDFAKPDATQGHLEFTYPPFAAYLLRPLAWLTVGQTVWIYTVVTIACLGLTVWWLVRPVADRWGQPKWFVFAVAIVLATGLEPIREAFSFGQINFVLWALILLDLLVLAPRGSRWLGIGIGLATAIKLVPGVFILYLLISRRWRAAAVAAGTAVLATLLAAALAPAETRIFWTEKLLQGEGVGQLEYTFNQSVMGVLARLAEPDAPSQLAWLALALPVLGYGLWRAARASKIGDDVAGLTLAGFAGSLASPVSWVHHLFWFVPALVVLVDAAVRPADVTSGLRRPPATISWAAVTYTTVTISVVALYEFNLGRPGGPVGFILGNWDVWLMLVLLALLPIRRMGATATSGAASAAAPARPTASEDVTAG